MKIQDMDTEIELTIEEAKATKGGWGYLLSSRWVGWGRKLPTLVYRNGDMEEEEELQV